MNDFQRCLNVACCGTWHSCAQFACNLCWGKKIIQMFQLFEKPLCTSWTYLAGKSHSKKNNTVSYIEWTIKYFTRHALISFFLPWIWKRNSNFHFLFWRWSLTKIVMLSQLERQRQRCEIGLETFKYFIYHLIA